VTFILTGYSLAAEFFEESDDSYGGCVDGVDVWYAEVDGEQ
jgi:hypothetical protein